MQIIEPELRKKFLKRPGMYVGDIDSGEGANNIILELLANALDMFIVHRASRITLKIEDNWIEFSDDGCGLPFQEPAPDGSHKSLAEWYFQELHYTPTATGHFPHVHVKYAGFGLALVNAASRYLTILSSDGRTEWSVKFNKAISDGTVHIKKGNFERGTKFSFMLEPEVFEGFGPDIESLKQTLRYQTFLYPGLKINFNGNEYSSEKGLKEFCDQKYAVKFGANPEKGFWHIGEYGDYKIQIALAGANSEETEFYSWVNGLETRLHGSHVDAFRNAMDEFHPHPEIAAIHVIMNEPQYAGPTKDGLARPEIVPALSKIISSIFQSEL